VADLTIVDPIFSTHLPRQLTAETGIDVLSHAVEVYNNVWTNDFTDGLCLQAVHLVFKYLVRAVVNGGTDIEVRTKMANAATVAGLAVGNTNISLVHAMSHSIGGVFSIHHGRVVGLILPYAVEYIANAGLRRNLDLLHLLGLSASDESQAGSQFAGEIRSLLQKIGLPVSLKEAGITQSDFEAELEGLCDRAEIDLGMLMDRRYSDRKDLKRLFEYAFDGRAIDF
jgi:acetaldehyde dehydrogenase / alcohol dehydrogenase